MLVVDSPTLVLLELEVNSSGRKVDVGNQNLFLAPQQVHRRITMVCAELSMLMTASHRLGERRGALERSRRLATLLSVDFSFFLNLLAMFNCPSSFFLGRSDSQGLYQLASLCVTKGGFNTHHSNLRVLESNADDFAVHQVTFRSRIDTLQFHYK